MTVPSLAFTLNSGSLKTCRTKHTDEDFELSLAFCADCGSPIYAVPHREGWGDDVVIQAGCLDEEMLLEVTPRTELNIKYRLGWVREVEGAEQRHGYKMLRGADIENGGRTE